MCVCVCVEFEGNCLDIDGRLIFFGGGGKGLSFEDVFCERPSFFGF